MLTGEVVRVRGQKRRMREEMTLILILEKFSFGDRTIPIHARTVMSETDPPPPVV